MNLEKPGNRSSSDPEKKTSGSGEQKKPGKQDPTRWDHSSSKTEASALKAMLGKGMKKKVKIKKPDSKRDENEEQRKQE